jgi:hypothetical protein
MGCGRDIHHTIATDYIMSIHTVHESMTKNNNSTLLMSKTFIHTSFKLTTQEK